VRLATGLFLISAVVVCAATAWGAGVDDCRTLKHHGQTREATGCFERLTRAPDSLARAEGYLGLQQYDSSNEEFRAAFKEQPRSGEVRYQWGLLYLEHYQPGDAAKLFEEALELDPNNGRAYLGLARVAGLAYDKKAVDLAREALQRDPKLYQARELLAYLALEDSKESDAASEAQKALAISGDALDGLAVLASIDWLNGKAQSEWMTQILKVNPVYGEAYGVGAHFFTINRRYREAIEYGQKALNLSPQLWSVRSDLGLNLMRVGRAEEARKQFLECYDAHWRDAQTKNALTLLDSLGQYQTFQTGTTELMLNKKEAGLLRPYIEPELQKAVLTYERKYKMKLPGKVRLEVYPNHEDFIVRTLGLPGQGGLLGVTFGMVVAMDSPSARPPGDFNWASTMWHELSHVYILTATNHLVPRWFTEGLAVHEEGAANPEWRDRLTPEIVSALKNKRLLPVTDLDRGFVRPEYPTQVLVSYYEAGKICDYISQKFGDDALLGMVHSYAARKTTVEAIQDNLRESADAFNREFQTWLDQQTGDTVGHFDEWKKAISSMGKTGSADEQIQQAMSLRDDYRGYVGPNNAYEVLGRLYQSKGDKVKAIEQLELYRNRGGTSPSILKLLAQLERDNNRNKQAEDTLTELTYIYPEDEQVHRMFGSLLLASNDPRLAVREFSAVLFLKPTDTAESHYDLAKALQAAHRSTEAKDEVVLALEAAPGFKPAQQLLLQLSQ
jgi:tetratricopeptide (TPR) repeat protein